MAVEDNAANLEAVLEPEGEDEAPAETPEDPENVTDEPAEEAEAGEEEEGNKPIYLTLFPMRKDVSSNDIIVAAPADEETPPEAEAEDPAPDDQAEDGGEADDGGDGGDGGE